jgi:hypothetical protein
VATRTKRCSFKFRDYLDQSPASPGQYWHAKELASNSAVWRAQAYEKYNGATKKLVGFAVCDVDLNRAMGNSQRPKPAAPFQTGP